MAHPGPTIDGRSANGSRSRRAAARAGVRRRRRRRRFCRSPWVPLTRNVPAERVPCRGRRRRAAAAVGRAACSAWSGCPRLRRCRSARGSPARSASRPCAARRPQPRWSCRWSRRRGRRPPTPSAPQRSSAPASRAAQGQLARQRAHAADRDAPGAAGHMPQVAAVLAQAGLVQRRERADQPVGAGHAADERVVPALAQQLPERAIEQGVVGDRRPRGARRGAAEQQVERRVRCRYPAPARTGGPRRRRQSGGRAARSRCRARGRSARGTATPGRRNATGGPRGRRTGCR